MTVGAGWQFLNSILVIACVIGVWNRKKWGYWGLVALYALSIANILFYPQVLGIGMVAIGAIIGLVVTSALINPQLDQFE